MTCWRLILPSVYYEVGVVYVVSEMGLVVRTQCLNSWFDLNSSVQHVCGRQSNVRRKLFNEEQRTPKAEPTKSTNTALGKHGTISKPQWNDSDGEILFSLIRCPDKVFVKVYVWPCTKDSRECLFLWEFTKMSTHTR